MARTWRIGRRRPGKRAGQQALVSHLAGHGRGLSFSFPLGRRKGM